MGDFLQRFNRPATGDRESETETKALKKFGQ